MAAKCRHFLGLGMNEDFLRTILPARGFYVAQLFDNEAHKKTQGFVTIEELIKWAADRLKKASASVSVVPAAFTKNGRGEKKDFREAVCGWIDFDVKPDKFTTLQAVFDCLDTLPPATAIVESGGGIHAYWRFDKPVNDTREWQVAMRPLWETVGSHRLDGNARNIVQPMRIPGSHNRKPTVMRDCVINKLDLLTCYKPEQFDANANYHQKAEVVMVDVDDRQLARVCNQVTEFNNKKGIVSEALWHAMAGIYAFMHEGDEAYHSISAGDPRYNREQTTKKLDRWRELGKPVTCEHIGNINISACKGCPYRSHHSPLAAAQHEFGIKTPLLPEGYTVSQEVTDAEGNLVVAGSLVVSSVGIHAQDGHEVISMELTSKAVKAKQIAIPASLLADKKQFSTAMLANGVVPPDVSQFDRLNNYIFSAYSLNRDHMGVSDGKVFGWGKDGNSFYCGRIVYEPHKVRANKLYTQPGHNILDIVSEQGSPDKWFDALSTATPLQWMMLFISVANPLIEYTSNERGAVLSLYGKSGGAKTSALFLAASVWGNPNSYCLNMSDTANFITERASRMSNLPVLVDEVTTMTSGNIVDFVYQVAGGAARGRLTRDAKERSKINWAAITTVTTNYSWWNKLSDGNGSGELSNSSAQLLRLVEFTVPPLRATTEAAQKFAQIRSNYGHLKHLVVPYLLSLSPELRREWMNKLADKVNKEYNLDTQQRFWTMVISIIEAGAEIVQRLNISIPDEVMPAIRDMIKKVVSRKIKESDDEIINRIIDGFITSNQRSILTVTKGVFNGTPEAAGRIFPVMRIERPRNVAYISVQALRIYLRNSRGNTGYSDLLQRLEEADRLLEGEAVVCLSEGVYGCPDTSIRCIKVKL